ncbi:hypothetical protein BGZ74_000220 [Mortierella antarctica]|nr:hypothetical protein BGZ74_000220 [Mortierella antarctica]
MDLSPFDIPHIVDAIVCSLTIAELYCMVLVNHTWNDLFTPHLWKDVINYRTLRALGEGERKFKWNCDHYFHSPAGRQALDKHSCHIQALTCRDQAILPLLVEAGCTHLLETNHIVYDSYRCHSPEYVPTDDQGLSDLAALVIINPRLLAVSVEGFHIGEMGEVQELADFLDLLEHNCPNVTCLSVLENNGVVRVSLPPPTISSITSVLELFPALHRPRIHQPQLEEGSALLQALPVILPHLQKLDLRSGRPDATQLAQFLNDPRVHLTSVAFHFVSASWSNPVLRPFFLPETGHWLPTALETLTFGKTRFGMLLLYIILASCGNLQELEAPLVMFDGSEPEKCPVWATRKLRVLKLGMTRVTRRYDSYWDLDDSRQQSENESEAAAARIAPGLMEQLGCQTQLAELELRLNDFTMIDDSPFLQLKVGFGNGLNQLRHLRRLESLVICELLHEAGPTETAYEDGHSKLSALVSSLQIKIPRDRYICLLCGQTLAKMGRVVASSETQSL